MLKQSKEHEAASFSLIASLPPTADIRWPMSVIVPISSALPLKADVAAVGRESPKLNIPLEFGREKLK
jgi:hypothetical protein